MTLTITALIAAAAAILSSGAARPRMQQAQARR